MSRKNIDFFTLIEVVNDLGEIFTTKDVSEDLRIKRANQKYVYHSHYHALVGGALSDHRAELNIIEIQKGTARGSRWKKAGLLYGGDNLDRPSSKAVNRILSNHRINTSFPNQNPKEYAMEQINREIYALNSDISKLHKEESNNRSCGGRSLLIGVSLIISGLCLTKIGWIPIAVVFFIFSILLIFGGFFVILPSSQVSALRKRIRALEEKKRELY